MFVQVALSRRLTYPEVAARLGSIFPYLTIGDFDCLTSDEGLTTAWPDIVVPVAHTESDFPTMLNLSPFPKGDQENIQIEVARLLAEAFSCRSLCDAEGYAPTDAPFWVIVWDSGQAFLADDCDSQFAGEDDGGDVRIVRSLAIPPMDIHSILRAPPN